MLGKTKLILASLILSLSPLNSTQDIKDELENIRNDLQQNKLPH